VTKEEQPAEDTMVFVELFNSGSQGKSERNSSLVIVLDV